MIDGSLDMKDGIGPTAVGTGFSLTLTPSLILQIAGVVIGALGVFYTRARIKESKLARLEAKRANDINEQRLIWEQGKSANQQKEEDDQAEASSEATAKTEEG
ncbi:hypothetical protein PODOV084v1_p0017 [Vibrio phage 340E47.2]|nr:hypothetical protein PODOV084v1_p0017 [Vibrio phage 340E47.2]QZI91922.1 hypothetical protein PODOV077v1_p0011 [Vibrio phage 5P1a]